MPSNSRFANSFPTMKPEGQAPEAEVSEDAPAQAPAEAPVVTFRVCLSHLSLSGGLQGGAGSGESGSR